MLKNKSEHNNQGRKGVALILSTFAILMIGGMIGLAIDGGIAFFLKARLSQAMDAASLAGANSLARGVNNAAQTANAQATAQNFFSANFPNNFWGCTVPAPTVTVTLGTGANINIRYVQVTGSVTTPLYFLRVLGLTTASLSSTATAQRRDVNLMVILDRSGSMAPGIAELVASSQWFVNQFAEGRDEVGLTTFGGTYYMIKPSTSFAAVSTAIGTLNAGNVYGTTDHAQPLWQTYKALAAINEPAALNVIVFFTDGEPNTIYADWSSYLKSPATCGNGPVGVKGPPWNPVLGYALVYSDNKTMGGLFANTTLLPPFGGGDSLSAGTVGTAYVNTAYDSQDSGITTTTSLKGCSYESNVENVASDFTQIAAYDYYGNATNPAVHPPTDCASCTSQYQGVTLTTFNATNLLAAAFNAGDTAAQRWRQGVLNNIVPMVDCIALNDGSPIDSTYMSRLANTTGSPIYNNQAPAGNYYYITSTSQLQPAFQAIASQILHLSQ
ncbi:MAG: VWA domain-containing protein [Bryobacteraceae bacterium]